MLTTKQPYGTPLPYEESLRAIYLDGTDIKRRNSSRNSLLGTNQKM
jgi:hypothetical protein